MRSLKTVTLLVLACLLAACAGEPEKPQSTLAENAAQANVLGLNQYAQGEYAAAADSFRLALRLTESVDDAAGATLNRLNLARSLLAQGKAEEAQQTAAPLFNGQRAGEAAAISVQAAQQLGRWDVAERMLADALQQCAGNCSAANSLMLMQARSNLQSGHAVAAQSQAEAVIARLRNGKQPAELANALRLAAEASLQLQQLDKASSAANEALQLDRERGLPARIAHDLLLLGAAQRTTQPAQAKDAYQRALSVAEAAGLATLAEKARKALSELSQ